MFKLRGVKKGLGIFYLEGKKVFTFNIDERVYDGEKTRIHGRSAMGHMGKPAWCEKGPDAGGKVRQRPIGFKGLG